jgi:outer membrane protein assembly factor BamB
MKWNKTAALTATVLFVMLLAVGCDKPPTVPEKPTGPDTTWTGVQTTYTTVATAGGEIEYAFDWGDNVVDTGSATASGTQYGARHTWSAAGTYEVKAMALLAKNTGKASEWSETKSVVVILNDVPIIDSLHSLDTNYTSIDADVPVRIWAHDPNGDSLRIFVQWKANKTDSSAAFFASPGSDSLAYAYSDTGTVWIKYWAKDNKGATSAVDSFSVIIGEAGGVVWYWWDAEEWPLVTTPVLFFNGTDTVVGASCDDDFYFYTLKVNSRRFAERADRVQTKYASTEETWFAGHAAYLAGYDHVIIGSDEGELYGIKGNGLSRKWNWPDSSVNGYTGDEFGPACIDGSRIYAGRDESLGTIYCFLDVGDDNPRLLHGPYYLTSGLEDAPIMDNSGYIYFTTDSGYLYKMDSVINTVIWRLPFPGARDVFGPVLGADGTIYCASDLRKLYAIDPTTNPGTVNWSYTLDGVGQRPAVGQYVFIGTDAGTMYALPLAGGSPVWTKTLSDAVSTTPILTTGGLMYVQTDDDQLHCLRQSDGATVWNCNCASVLPATAPRARRFANSDITPSPTITGRGNIIVVGEQATYCVKGYPDKLLDTSAAWPKWMKNVYNTGR